MTKMSLQLQLQLLLLGSLLRPLHSLSLERRLQSRRLTTPPLSIYSILFTFTWGTRINEWKTLNWPSLSLNYLGASSVNSSHCRSLIWLQLTIFSFQTFCYLFTLKCYVKCEEISYTHRSAAWLRRLGLGLWLCGLISAAGGKILAWPSW